MLCCAVLFAEGCYHTVLITHNSALRQHLTSVWHGSWDLVKGIDGFAIGFAVILHDTNYPSKHKQMQVYAFQHSLLHLLPSLDSQKLQGQHSMPSMKRITSTISLVNTRNF